VWHKRSDSDYQQATSCITAISTKLSHWKLWTPRKIDILFIWNEYTYTSINASSTPICKGEACSTQDSYMNSIQILVGRLKKNYIIRKYVLPIWSEHKYIFSHRIVHWVHNYKFRPCTLAIVRLCCKLNKQLYNMCVEYSGGNEISSRILVGGMVLDHYGPVLIWYNNALVYYYKHVENQISVHKLSTGADIWYPIKLKVHFAKLFLEFN
jgi:hypothetical protein